MDHKRSFCDLCQRVFYLSSKSFIVSGVTFRSIIHLEFIFMYGVRECTNFILFFFLNIFIEVYLPYNGVLASAF